MQWIFVIPYFVWLVLSVGCFAVGEYFSKKFANDPHIVFVVFVLSSYMLGTLAWLPAILQKNQLSIVGVIWSVLSLVATVSIGVLMFNETLNIFSIVGIIFAFIAIVLLSMA